MPLDVIFQARIFITNVFKFNIRLILEILVGIHLYGRILVLSIFSLPVSDSIMFSWIKNFVEILLAGGFN